MDCAVCGTGAVGPVEGVDPEFPAPACPEPAEATSVTSDFAASGGLAVLPVRAGAGGGPETAPSADVVLGSLVEVEGDGEPGAGGGAGDEAEGGEVLPLGSVLFSARTDREDREFCPFGTDCIVAQETTIPAMRTRMPLLPAHCTYFNFNIPRESYLTNYLFKLLQLYFFRASRSFAGNLL
jgi:hypothetical protein